MDKKRLIKQLWETVKTRDELLLLMQDCENFIENFSGYRSPNFASNNTKSKAGEDSTSEAILDLEYYKGKLRGLSFRLRQCELEFEKYLSYLESTERSIFILRYLHNLQWDKVGARASYSRIQVIRIHNKALDKILKKIS